MMAPQFEQAARALKGKALLVKVNSDEAPRLAARYAIRSIPTIAFFAPGQQPRGVVGFRPMDQLEQAFGLAEFTKPAAQA